MSDIAFALSADNLQKAENFCKDLASKDSGLSIKLDTNIIKMSIEGLGLEQQPRIAATVFELFTKHNIPIKASVTSNIKIDCFINKIHEKQAMDMLIDEFGLQ